MITSREQLIGELRTNLTRTAALYQVGQSLTSLESLDALLQQVVDSASFSLPADRVCVAILDTVGQRVLQIVRGGPGAAQIAEVDYTELRHGLTGWVLREHQPALSPQDVPDPRENWAVQQRRKETRCGAIMVAPLIHRERVLGTITAINRPDQRDFTTDDLGLLVAMANQAATAIANAHLFQEVQEQAITDSLTGFFNRRGFFTRGERVLKRASLEDQPVALIMLDIDHFKQINDRYGHAVGDGVLAEVAVRCRANTRTHDLLGRLGGDEFVLLLPQTPLAVAGQIAARVRRAVAATPIAGLAGSIPATLSIGVAAPIDGRGGLEALLARADGALYAAKEAGRNRVVVQGRGGLHLLDQDAELVPPPAPSGVSAVPVGCE
jgi:diguanylate cyclase (GGDEF)-like protein